MARREITGRKLGVTADLIERDSGAPDPDDDHPTEDDDPDDDEPDDDEPTRHDDATAQRPGKVPPIRGPPHRLVLNTAPKTRPNSTAFDDGDAYSVPEFCRRHRVSVQMFYKRPDLMPASFYVGTRRLISREAAARWRAEREAAGACRTFAE